MSNETQALVVAGQALTNKEFSDQYNRLVVFVKSKLIEGKDYGLIPGTEKKVLHKPGAEKVAFLFQLKINPKCIEKVEDWDNGFFFYKYRVELIHFGSEKFAGAAERSCNSKEKKYAFTTIAERFATDEQKQKAIGRKKNKKYGTLDLILAKTPYEAADQVNTIMAMAQKRAIVAAVVQATMASELFDADISEYEEEAPNKSVPKEDDLRRNRILMQLHVNAAEHGWTEAWIHKAIKKKWEVDSLTELSNNQIEELKDFIIEKYELVEKGNPPILKGAELKEEDRTILVTAKTDIQADQLLTENMVEFPVEGEIIESNEITYKCKGPSHTENDAPETTLEEPWCRKKCEEEYYGPQKNKSRAADRPWEKWSKGRQTSEVT